MTDRDVESPADRIPRSAGAPFNVGVSLGVLDTRMFTMMVIMALTTTAMAGPFIPRRPCARPETSLTSDDTVLKAA